MIVGRNFPKFRIEPHGPRDMFQASPVSPKTKPWECCPFHPEDQLPPEASMLGKGTNNERTNGSLIAAWISRAVARSWRDEHDWT